MIFQTPEFLPALPEIFLLGMICLILLVDLFLTQRARAVTYLLSQAALVATLVLVVVDYSPQPAFTFNGHFVNDTMASVLKSFVLLSAFVIFLYSRDYLRLRNLFRGEFFVLGLFGVLGMMVMISGHSLLTIYLGLELLSLALYALVALQRDSLVASEAAMKYFVLGAMASAMLLYGMSMLYGVAGTLDLAEISQRIGAGQVNPMILAFGLVFLIIGIAFKLGAVPFHMWIPDVYHGAPTAVTLYVGTAPKLAAFAMLMRLLVDGLGGLQAEWQNILVLLAFLSLVAGNVIAIAQSNIKRMLAYSTISHVGFLLLGVLSGSAEGYAAGMFYAVSYVITGLGAFGMIIFMSRAGFEAEQLSDYKGLNERSPWFAAVMLVMMFSLAGVPPFLGFWAKLWVIQAIVETGFIGLAAAAVVMSVIGAFYYLRIVKLMYFDKAEEALPLVSPLDMRIALSTNGLAVLGLGLFPGALMALCLQAFN